MKVTFPNHYTSKFIYWNETINSTYLIMAVLTYDYDPRGLFTTI